MTPELAQAALQLLDRTTIRGAETRVFLAIQNALIALATPKAPAPDVLDSAPASK